MPELPEVETTRRGIVPHITKNAIEKVIIRETRLRWPTPNRLNAKLKQQAVRGLRRRAKYLLMDFDHGCLIMHLGMSGCLRWVKQSTPLKAHDHIDLIFKDGNCLRYNDPRRFGSFHWTTKDPMEHKLLAHLGPEPLSEDLNGELLYEKSKSRKVNVKQFIGDNKVVVGVGNIYANEALFATGILPTTPANKIKLKQYTKLAAEIKKILTKAIKAGGTTLKDFYGSDGKPGYFSQQLQVYGRTEKPCLRCKEPIQDMVLGGRRAFYCPKCQQ